METNRVRLTIYDTKGDVDGVYYLDDGDQINMIQASVYGEEPFIEFFDEDEMLIVMFSKFISKFEFERLVD